MVPGERYPSRDHLDHGRVLGALVDEMFRQLYSETPALFQVQPAPKSLAFQFSGFLLSHPVSLRTSSCLLQ